MAYGVTCSASKNDIFIVHLLNPPIVSMGKNNFYRETLDEVHLHTNYGIGHPEEIGSVGASVVKFVESVPNCYKRGKVQ